MPVNLCPWILARGLSPKSSRPLGSLAAFQTTVSNEESKRRFTGSYKSPKPLLIVTAALGPSRTSNLLSSTTASTLLSNLMPKQLTLPFRELISTFSSFKICPYLAFSFQPAILNSLSSLKELKSKNSSQKTLLSFKTKRINGNYATQPKESSLESLTALAFIASIKKTQLSRT